MPVAREELALGHDQMDPGALDVADRLDGACELALERAQMVNVLDEVGGAEAVGAVEDFVADRAAIGQALLGHGQAQAPDLVAGDVDLAAVGPQLVGHVLLVQQGHDLAAVLAVQVAVEQGHLRRGQPAGQIDEKGQDARGNAGHGR